MPRFILALDQGTTSSRALVIDQAGAIQSVGQFEFPQSFPNPGWVEHDPFEIWDSQLRAARGALAEGERFGVGHGCDRYHEPTRDDGRLGPCVRVIRFIRPSSGNRGSLQWCLRWIACARPGG